MLAYFSISYDRNQNTSQFGGLVGSRRGSLVAVSVPFNIWDFLKTYILLKWGHMKKTNLIQNVHIILGTITTLSGRHDVPVLQ